ncbi:hypothetical protein CEXT_522981 [Caerostris extrusa]|uniref:LAGLIDADG homing endonuclease n=1 Tax=Caerostris extrusa TaxID=172846 RepID=A0AAV4P7I0_CAEEX|nr:hypothetical protein CEXT_522981 [Caerostris extrusa]
MLASSIDADCYYVSLFANVKGRFITKQYLRKVYRAYRLCPKAKTDGPRIERLIEDRAGAKTWAAFRSFRGGTKAFSLPKRHQKRILDSIWHKSNSHRDEVSRSNEIGMEIKTKLLH